MVVVGEPAAGETIFFIGNNLGNNDLHCFYHYGIWPSGKAAIFDVVSVGSSPSIPIIFLLYFIINVLGTSFMECFSKCFYFY